MKCSLCGTDTHRNTKGKALCRDCQEHWKYDRELVRANGVMALPHIYFRAVVRRLKLFFCAGVNSSRQFFAWVIPTTSHPLTKEVGDKKGPDHF